ncbi:hypothetical protein JTE90_011170 [Oedothorax gibbosus]|uniref:Secreted protein n=1 Tax=Oedothorax gibbosus TaxID=931172 RepID=A0AAV6THV6_9ARAC|nr:hypothetical protein JTE90_011170 [Oedothorax gibbosus]
MRISVVLKESKFFQHILLYVMVLVVPSLQREYDDQGWAQQPRQQSLQLFGDPHHPRQQDNPSEPKKPKKL